VYGTCAVTAVTAQSSSRVDDVLALPADVVRGQIDSVHSDTTLSATKIGMLAAADIVTAVVAAIRELNLPDIVLDPVMVATGGGTRNLLSPDAVSILMRELLPLASLVSPNAPEAETLAGISVRSLETAREAAKRIVDLGARAVVVKGGHLSGPEATDLLYDGRSFTEFSSPRRGPGADPRTGSQFPPRI